MVWDSELPADSSKIRNIGLEIRNNWKALENGSMSFNQLNLSNSTLNSFVISRQENSGLLYCKSDSSGTTQLFFENEKGSVQISNLDRDLQPNVPSYVLNASKGYYELREGWSFFWGSVFMNTGANIASRTVTLEAFSNIYVVTASLVKNYMNTMANPVTIGRSSTAANSFTILFSGESGQRQVYYTGMGKLKEAQK